jgi:hypothetical protein
MRLPCNRQWVIPPEANAGFVAAMEDVLETYQRPRDPDRPLVCLDETSKLIDRRDAPPATITNMSANRVANLFMIFAPLEGWRRVDVTDRHAAVDYAKVLKDLSDVHFPAADKIVLVQDNLSTHTPASTPPSPPLKRAAWSKGSNGALQAQARKLARHGRSPGFDQASTRGRARRSDQAVPEPPHPRQAHTLERSRRLAEPSKQTPRQSRLAIHDSRRPRQNLKRLYPQFE